MFRLPPSRLAASIAAAVLAPLTLWAASPLVAGGEPTPEQLQSQISGQKARERSLASAAERLRRLEAGLSAEIAVLERRLGEVRADLARGQQQLAATQAGLRAERARVQRLRRKLALGRELLARRLREQYTASSPDLVSLLLSARSLSDLLEQGEFLRRLQRNDERIVDDVRDARAQSERAARRLAALERRQRDAVLAVQRREAALVRMNDILQSRRQSLAAARAAREAALRDTRAGRQQAERQLSRLLAERARAARAVGPGGPWSIPWPIVQCESGGQNLPPNWAGASGYYQFMPATWRLMGGSTPHAYQASKAEQDRLAAKLWAGGSGARNWDCAAMVSDY
ncbi:MAG: transglycosylase family protein [Solirubrobacterales bacterium]